MADGTAPIRIQRRRIKGWRMPENTVSVTRPGPFGNPFDLRRAEHCWTALAHGFRADRAGRIAASIAMFRAWILQGKPAVSEGCGIYIEVDGKAEPAAVSPPISAEAPPSIERIKAELRGKNLACWCRLDQPCHADVLLEIANG